MGRCQLYPTPVNYFVLQVITSSIIFVCWPRMGFMIRGLTETLGSVPDEGDPKILRFNNFILEWGIVHSKLPFGACNYSNERISLGGNPTGWTDRQPLPPRRPPAPRRPLLHPRMRNGACAFHCLRFASDSLGGLGIPVENIPRGEPPAIHTPANQHCPSPILSL